MILCDRFFAQRDNDLYYKKESRKMRFDPVEKFPRWRTRREEVSSTREMLDPISSRVDRRSTKFVSGNGIDSAEENCSLAVSRSYCRLNRPHSANYATQIHTHTHTHTHTHRVWCTIQRYNIIVQSNANFFRSREGGWDRVDRSLESGWLVFMKKDRRKKKKRSMIRFRKKNGATDADTIVCVRTEEVQSPRGGKEKFSWCHKILALELARLFLILRGYTENRIKLHGSSFEHFLSLNSGTSTLE